MRVLVSAAWMGGAGGAERALHSVLRALEDDEVDVVVRHRLSGPYAHVGAHVRVYSLLHWRWRWANMRSGLKGAIAQRLINPLRRMALPQYDVYLQFYSGADLNDAVRAHVRLLIPSGNQIPTAMAARYTAIAMQAPDNDRFVPESARTTLLPPPVYHLADASRRPHIALPERFYLTVFNPYGGVKGTEDLLTIVETAPLPFVWCHSEATEAHQIPAELAEHPRIIHVVDATPAELRWLYENCDGYVSVSKTEGFGWSIADALRYSPRVYSRPIGILTFPAFSGAEICDLDPDLHFEWHVPAGTTSPGDRDMSSVSGPAFRSQLTQIVRLNIGKGPRS